MMKKILSIALFAVLTLSVQAQLQYGVTGGLNINQMHASNSDYKEYINKTRPGFVLGPTLVYTIPTTPFGIDVSALFDYRSAKSIDKEISVSNSSFQFPINLRYSFITNEIVNVYVSAGPQFGVNIGSQNQYLASGIGKTTSHDMERSWKRTNSTMSMNIGVGGVVMEHVTVKVNYNFAFQSAGNIIQTDLVEGTSRQLTSGKLHACQIILGYLF